MTAPHLLPENNGLVLVGEKPWTVALLSGAEEKALHQSNNFSGRQNSDVLGRSIGYHLGKLGERAYINFPAHFTAQEAALYVAPHELLRKAIKNPVGPWWTSPHTNAELRRTLPRLERYLATSITGQNPGWEWIESDLLPEESLLAFARDDDFSHGVLASPLFSLWWKTYRTSLSAPDLVLTFPFPWPPLIGFSALNREQQEHRFSISRAARTGDQEQLNSAVTEAYGLSHQSSEGETLRFLSALNQKRSGTLD